MLSHEQNVTSKWRSPSGPPHAGPLRWSIYLMYNVLSSTITHQTTSPVSTSPSQSFGGNEKKDLGPGSSPMEMDRRSGGLRHSTTVMTLVNDDFSWITTSTCTAQSAPNGRPFCLRPFINKYRKACLCIALNTVYITHRILTQLAWQNKPYTYAT